MKSIIKHCKFAAVLLMAVMSLVSCQKDNGGPANPGTTGQLRYGGATAADGIGYYLVADSTHETLVLQNVPAEYKRIDVDAHVSITFFDTGTTLQTQGLPGVTGPRIIVIKSLRKL